MAELSKPVKKKNRQRSWSSLSGYPDKPSRDYSSSSTQMQRSSSMSVLADMPEGKDKNGSGARGWSIPWRWTRMRKAYKRKATGSAGRRSTDLYSKGKRVPSKPDQPEDPVIPSEEYSREETSLTVQGRPSNAGTNSHNLRVGRGGHPNGGGEITPHRSSNYSYTSLSLKYQPKRFDDIAGQEIITKAISNAVQRSKVASLYLFHGPRGTGKSSTARILAVALNCEFSTSSWPCWNCKGCTRSIYMMELCSGNRFAGFERIRTLIQSTSFAHAIPGFKVFVIEECHLLTAEEWDELLNIEGVYGSNIVFILVTTDADGLPATVSSRCQKYFFPKLKDMDIKLKLARIASQEGIMLESEALQLIIAKAEGSLREAEHLLDQLSLLGTRIGTSMVQEMVRLIPRDKLNYLLMAAISGDTMQTIKYATELTRTGIEPQALVSQLASSIKDLLLGSAASTFASSSLAIAQSDKRVPKITPNLMNNQSEKLCHALEILVGLEKQSRSSIDQSTRLFAALLQIASQDNPKRATQKTIMPKDIVLPSVEAENSSKAPIDAQQHKQTQIEISMQRMSISETSEPPDEGRADKSTTMEDVEENRYCGAEPVKEPTLARINNIEEIWLNMVEKIESRSIKEFLHHRVKLASFTISSANAIVHLMFKKPKDKMTAQMSEESISKALQNALGVPVAVNMSLEPLDLRMVEYDGISTTKKHVGESSRSKRQPSKASLAETIYHTSSMHNTLTENKQEDHNTIAMAKHDSPAGGKKAITPSTPQTLSIQRYSSQEKSYTFPNLEENPLTSSADAAQLMRRKKIKHCWPSVSSIQQSDASVEPYSQDILFERANMDTEGRAGRTSKFKKSLSKGREDHYSHFNAGSMEPNCTWTCKDTCCHEGKIRTDGS